MIIAGATEKMMCEQFDFSLLKLAPVSTDSASVSISDNLVTFSLLFVLIYCWFVLIRVFWWFMVLIWIDLMRCVLIRVLNCWICSDYVFRIWNWVMRIWDFNYESDYICLIIRTVRKLLGYEKIGNRRLILHVSAVFHLHDLTGLISLMMLSISN